MATQVNSNHTMALSALFCLCAAGLALACARASAGSGFRVERFEANPVIHREMHGMIGRVGNNINGPSLIRVPDWVDDPLGVYYLYFAHHAGAFIRMAYANRVEGPWKIYHGGVLPMEATPGYEGRPHDHVASPDVHVDHDEQRIRMYFHCANPSDGPEGQGTYLAVSEDGLHFEALDEYLGEFYFRVFEWDGWHYALAKHLNRAILYRSRDGITGFERGPDGRGGPAKGLMNLGRFRHTAVWLHEGVLYVFYSRGHDEPEHIMVSEVPNLDDDWFDWEFSDPKTLLKPVSVL